MSAIVVRRVSDVSEPPEGGTHRPCSRCQQECWTYPNVEAACLSGVPIVCLQCSHVVEDVFFPIDEAIAALVSSYTRGEPS